MPKMIHAANFNLGQRFHGIGKAGDFVRRALKDSFQKSIKFALEEKVDLFLVTGNLFASNRVSRNLIEFTMREIARLGQIPFVVVPGNNDYFDENSLYRSIPEDSRPENLFVFGENNQERFHFPDSEIIVYGRAIVGPDTSEAIVDGFKKQSFPGVHVLAACGQWSAEKITVESEKGWQRSFDYLALAGSTGCLQVNDKCWDCGAPEAVSFASTDAGQILMVDVTSDSVHVERQTTGQLLWREVELDNNHFRFNLEIERELLKHCGPNTLLRATVTGKPSSEGLLDLRLLEAKLRDQFCYLELNDKRMFDLNSRYPDYGQVSSVFADFVNLLQKDIEKTPADERGRLREALYTGSALLAGKDQI